MLIAVVRKVFLECKKAEISSSQPQLSDVFAGWYRLFAARRASPAVQSAYTTTTNSPVQGKQVSRSPFLYCRSFKKF